jgi:excinuclease UvrABC nuclease subunit
MTIKEIIKNAIPKNRLVVSGVYFLIRNERIVYVGKSTDIYSRLNTHITDKKKEFDSFYVLKTTELNTTEKHYIETLKPEYNIALVPKHSSKFLKRYGTSDILSKPYMCYN